MGLAGVVGWLRCPVCGQPVALAERVVRCPAGHSFDVARQGYVNFQSAATAAPSADTAAMVADRAAFLAAGHYQPLADRVAALAAAAEPGLVVECATGTGYYLAAVLDRCPGAVGVGLDSSVPAVKRAARAHPAGAAIGWNAWQPWPLAGRSADVLLAVFAPRNPAEFHRVLAPGGTLIVVTPGPEHLAELRERVALLAVDPDKDSRLDAALGDRFTVLGREELRVPLELSPGQVRQVVGMGPNAHHAHGADGVELPERTAVTAAFVVSAFRPR
jgi:23S rRNA (guanine745-N1)-methyltransferase